MYSILAMNLLLAEDNPGLQISPLPPHRSWEPSCEPPYLAYAVLNQHYPLGYISRLPLGSSLSNRWALPPFQVEALPS